MTLVRWSSNCLCCFKSIWWPYQTMRGKQGEVLRLWEGRCEDERRLKTCQVQEQETGEKCGTGEEKGFILNLVFFTIDFLAVVWFLALFLCIIKVLNDITHYENISERIELLQKFITLNVL